MPPFSLYANATKRYRYIFTTVQKQQQQQNYAKKLQHYIYAANKSVLLLLYERSMQTTAEVVTMTQ